MLLLSLIGLFIISHISVASKWQGHIDILLKTNDENRQKELTESIIRAKPPWQELVSRLQTRAFSIIERGRWFLKSVTGSDGIVRPWVVYVPKNYNLMTPTPAMMILHGSVSRNDVMPDPVDWARETPFVSLAEKRGWLLIFPFGQHGAAWWDMVGMKTVLDILKMAKDQFNIDDDRVYLGGFSDGGSAAFLYAMTMPDAFAAFVSLNGHLSVAGSESSLSTYFSNLAGTPVYVVTTDRDQLYPSSKMQYLIDLARRAGADIFYRQLRGEHSMSYADDEFPAIGDYLDRHPRDPFPTRIRWETADPAFGACCWFVIDEVENLNDAWQAQEFNSSIIDSAVAAGFVPDVNFDGPGIKVSEIIDGDYLAARTALRPGDVISGIDSLDIEAPGDMVKFRENIRPGAMVTVMVKRANESLVTSGIMPAARPPYVFKEARPSAEASVSFSANTVDAELLRVKSFRVLVHPQMVNLAYNLRIAVNDKQVFNRQVDADPGYILRRFLENRDRKLLYVNEVKISV